MFGSQYIDINKGTKVIGKIGKEPKKDSFFHQGKL